jgi:hypothetical protein
LNKKRVYESILIIFKQKEFETSQNQQKRTMEQELELSAVIGFQGKHATSLCTGTTRKWLDQGHGEQASAK